MSYSQLKHKETASTKKIHKAVAGDTSPTDGLPSNNAKIQQKQSEVTLIPQTEQLAGAYYMKVLNPSDLSATWEVVEKALESLSDTDFAPVEGEHSAHSIMYYQDSYALTRSRLCQLDNTVGDDCFLELQKLGGNGFIFQDQFVVGLESKLEGFEPVKQLEKPHDLEEATTSNLAFLDLSDETTGYPMIEKWLTALQPKKGVQYDQMVVYEALSGLAWNLQDEDNFKVLVEYKDDIVAHVLDILRVEETTSVPTGYFAAKVLEQFFSLQTSVPDKLKNWETVLSIQESVDKWSSPNKKAVHQELTSSRGVVTILLGVLRNAAAMASDSPDADATAKADTFVRSLGERMTNLRASWPANCTMELLCQALRVATPEEEVEGQ